MEKRMKPLAEGETVILYREGEDHHRLRLSRGRMIVDNFGVVDLTSVVGKYEGAMVSIGGTTYSVFRPSLRDIIPSWSRPTQIVTPKDAQYMIYLAGVVPGALVLEAGTGSGLLTVFLATAVGPQGRIVSYDRRAEHQKVAKEMLQKHEMLDRVTLKLGDVSEGFDETDADSVVLDLPEPWAVLGAAQKALRPGGSIATYVPTYNQLERTVRCMRDTGFSEVFAVELLERTMHVGEGGTRPSFEMLGHTGFLQGARKLRQ